MNAMTFIYTFHIYWLHLSYFIYSHFDIFSESSWPILTELDNFDFLQYKGHDFIHIYIIFTQHYYLIYLKNSHNFIHIFLYNKSNLLQYKGHCLIHILYFVFTEQVRPRPVQRAWFHPYSFPNTSKLWFMQQSCMAFLTPASSFGV